MKLTTWILIAVVLVVGAGAVYLLLHKNLGIGKQTASNQSAPTPQAVYAAPGKLTADFPTQLLLGANQSTQSSFAIAYPSSTQSTATIESSDSVTSLYNAYLSFFQKNKYEVLNHQDSKLPANIYAITAGNDVSVQIAQDGTKSRVIVSYLKK